MREYDLIELCRFPENVTFKLVLRGTRDGLTARVFHQLCDNIMPTLIVIQSTGYYIFGGYTSQAWSNTCSYKTYINEFLFEKFIEKTNQNNVKRSGRIVANIF